MERLARALERLGATDCLNKFETYYKMLVEWNEKFNLTAVTDADGVEQTHFLDSLAGLPYMGATVLDIGAGAGFPSLPLAIVDPKRSFTLVDSLAKRVGFLNAVIEMLGLTNAVAVHARAEDLPKSVLYDTVTARAVAPLNVLVEYCLPFVRVGGQAVLYKAKDVEGEAAAATRAVKLLGGEQAQIERITVPETEIERAFVRIRKVSPTPAAYPRGGNKPRSKPL